MSLAWLDLGLNPGLPDHWGTLPTRPMSQGTKMGKKQLYGRFKRLINNISHQKTWTWLIKGNLKSPFNNPLVTVPKAPNTIGITVTFMFHSFSNPWQGRGIYPSFHILSANSTIFQILLFFSVLTGFSINVSWCFYWCLRSSELS